MSLIEEILGKAVEKAVGIPEDQAAALVAEALPEVIDKVSPDGEQPLADEVGKALDSLRS